MTVPGPCVFAGLAHDGPVTWVEMACLHGHTEAGWGCASCLGETLDRASRSGAVRCGRCGHVCGLAVRVPATGQVAGAIPWPAEIR
jgi:hypothetical protein